MRIADEINIEMHKSGFPNLNAVVGDDGLIQIRIRNGDWRKVHWNVRIIAGCILKEFKCVYDYCERPFGKGQSGFVYSAVHEIRIEGMTCFDTLSREKALISASPGKMHVLLRERQWTDTIEDDE